MERDAQKLKVDEGAEEEQSDEQMDAVGSGGMKWKAEDNIREGDGLRVRESQ